MKRTRAAAAAAAARTRQTIVALEVLVRCAGWDRPALLAVAVVRVPRPTLVARTTKFAAVPWVRVWIRGVSEACALSAPAAFAILCPWQMHGGSRHKAGQEQRHDGSITRSRGGGHTPFPATTANAAAAHLTTQCAGRERARLTLRGKLRRPVGGQGGPGSERRRSKEIQGDMKNLGVLAQGLPPGAPTFKTPSRQRRTLRSRRCFLFETSPLCASCVRIKTRFGWAPVARPGGVAKILKKALRAELSALLWDLVRGKGLYSRSMRTGSSM